MTRTSEKLYLLDPPNIRVGSGIKRIADPGFSSHIAPETSAPVVKAETVLSTQAPQNTTSQNSEELFGIAPANTFALEILNRVKSLITGSGIQIQSVNHNQYMESYFFEKGSEFSRIDIGYNGKKKITRLNVSHTSELSSQLQKLLSPLINSLIVPASSVSTIDKIRSEKGFINELLKRIQSLSDSKDIRISDLAEQQWNIRLTFSRGQEVAVFDIYFNGKFIFGKYGPVMNLCNSNALIKEVDDLIINGLNS
jgi:hypothetical protein